MSGNPHSMDTASTPIAQRAGSGASHAMKSTTKALAALLLLGVAGLAQADTEATLYLQYGVTLTGVKPEDGDGGADYPPPSVDGVGGYAVDLQWPGHAVQASGEDQFGLPLYEPGYGYVASAAFIGGYAASSLSFPGTATGSAQAFGTALSTWTLLPGVTLTIEGNLAGNAFLEHEHTRGAYRLNLTTSDTDTDELETLYALDGTWDTPGYEFGDAFAFSYTNATDRPVYRSFSIASLLSLEARGVPPVVTPVPEPQAYALMLAGLAMLGLLGRWRTARHRLRC